MSGIYVIRRVGSGECYVGSSQNIERRFKRHKWELGRGTHASPILQNAWNKYGAGAFVFEVLESCEIESLLQREQHFLDAMRPCFNTAVVAGAPMRGRTHRPETKAAISRRLMGNQFRKGHHHSAEARELRAASMRGRKHTLGYRHTAEARARISAAMKGKRHALGAKSSAEVKAQRIATRQETLRRRKLEGKYPLATGSV